MMPDPPRSKPSWIHWSAAALGLIVYFATLCSWVTFDSLSVVGQMTGWNWWGSNLQGPLNFLIGQIVRMFPAGVQVPVLNGLAAILAALTLVQLARCVRLLPQDRTREQRLHNIDDFGLLNTAGFWVPVAAAVLFLGFQLTFWESAVTYTGEMLTVLLFGFVIRALLEYRLSENNCWLHASALAAGLAAANAWVIWGLLPLYFVALVWIKRRDFFAFRFLLPAIGLFVLGFLCFLILPAIEYFSPSSDFGFWKLTSLAFSQYKSAALGVPRYILLILALTSIFPALCLSIRWPSHAGDTSRMGGLITNLMFHVIHAMFLAVCVWVFFDPRFSPRSLSGQYAWLPLYFLSALSIGYFSGYFLLVCAAREKKKWEKSSPLVRGIQLLVTGVVWAGSFALPAWIAWRNAPEIAARNTPVVKRVFTAMADSLPAEGSVVVSERPEMLILLQGILDERNEPLKHILISRSSLAQPLYHRIQSLRYGERWPEILDPAKLPDPIPAAGLANILALFANQHPIHYLHPSTGQLYFEYFELQPRGLVFKLQARKAGQIAPPPLTQEDLDFARSRWESAAPLLESLQSGSNTSQEFTYARMLASAAQNAWGVALQRQGKFEEAASAFDTATAIFNENLPAQVNTLQNRLLADPSAEPEGLREEVRTTLAGFRARWAAVVRNHGPFDEAYFCLELGHALKEFSFLRQSAIELLRARELDPANPLIVLEVADVYIDARQPKAALEQLDAVRKLKPLEELPEASQWEFIRLESLANYYQTNFTTAESLLQEGLERFPQSGVLQQTLSSLYINTRQYTNALKALDRQLTLDSTDRKALLNLGAVRLELGQWEQAIEPLNRLLQLNPDHVGGRFNRAMAQLRMNRIDQAQEDLEHILEDSPNYAPALLHLGDIAASRDRPQEALNYYERFLLISRTGTAESEHARKRVEELKSGTQAP